MGNHITECNRCSGHLKSDIETTNAQLLHGSCNGLAFSCVDSQCGSHLTRNVKTVFAKVCHYDVFCSCKLGYGRGHGSNQTCTRNEDILAKKGEAECSMGCISKGVHDGGHVVADTVIKFHDIALRNAKVFCKGTLTVYTHTNAVFADVLQTTTAIAAMTAGYMALTGDTVAHLDVAYTHTYLFHCTHILVADGHRCLDGFLTPFVPFIDVEIGSADSGFTDFDEDVVDSNLGNGNFFHPYSLGGFFLYQCFHVFRYVFVNNEV